MVVAIIFGTILIFCIAFAYVAYKTHQKSVEEIEDLKVLTTAYDGSKKYAYQGYVFEVIYNPDLPIYIWKSRTQYSYVNRNNPGFLGDEYSFWHSRCVKKVIKQIRDKNRKTLIDQQLKGLDNGPV